MKISIKSKIIQSFCMLIIVLLSAQIGFNVFLSKSYFISENINEVEKLYKIIVEQYSDDPEILYGLTQEADATRGYSVQIWGENDMIYTSRTVSEIQEQGENFTPEEGGVFFNPQGEGNHTSPPPQNTSLQQDKMEKMLERQLGFSPEDFSDTPEAIVITAPNSQMETISLRGTFLYNGEARYISITLPMESITNSITLFTKSNLLISLIVLLLGLLFIIQIAKEITKPIMNIQEVSQKLANLEFSHLANEKVKTKELSSLAHSINSMSSQLERSMDELQLANVELQRDVEKQRKMESMRKQFVANVSHEMKTPLALLQIYCENLKHNVNGIDKDKSCDIIIEETMRLNKIVSDMLNISSLENELLQPVKDKLNLSEITTNLYTTMMPLLSAYTMSLDVEEERYVYGDKQQLEEAMRNYIMNAISHTNELDEIKITLKKIENNIRVSVYNEGVQIPENKKNRLWESFYKSNEARTREEGANAGLGLYIVKLTMDNHGGLCGVRNINKGVEFTIEIPELTT